MADHKDYADPAAHLANATSVEWLHPLSDIVGGLIDAGLSLDWLHEHAQVPWRMFEMLVQKDDGDWHWPDKQWLPLAVSLQARAAGLAAQAGPCRRRSAICSRSHRKATASGSQPSQRAAWNRYSPVSTPPADSAPRSVQTLVGDLEGEQPDQQGGQQHDQRLPAPAARRAAAPGRERDREDQDGGHKLGRAGGRRATAASSGSRTIIE